MGETGSRCIALIVRGKNFGFRNDDFGVVLQLLEAAVGDDISGVESLHLGHSSLGDARFYVMDVGDVVLDEENIRLIPIVLDGRGGDEDDVFERVQKQTGIDELVGKERVGLVLKEGAQFEGSGGGVDLIVGGLEPS